MKRRRRILSDLLKSIMLFIAMSALFLTLAAGAGFWLQFRDMDAGIYNIFRLLNEYQRSASATLEHVARTDISHCSQALPKLNLMATVTPYTRSAGVISGDSVVCSSFSGDTPVSISDIFSGPRLFPGYLPQAITARSLHRHAGDFVILYTRPLNENQYAYTVLDTRYIRELISVMAGDTHLNYTLSVGKGSPVSFGILSELSAPLTSQTLKQSGVHITAYSTTRSLIRYVTDMLPVIIPGFILIALLTGAFWKKWNNVRMSNSTVIRQGMRKGEFYVCYQPICDAEGRCHGAEALMRWEKPDGRLIPPDAFIPAAESEKLIVPLTRHLMALIARDFSDWKPKTEFHLSINVSADHLCHDDFMEDIKGLSDVLPPFVSLVAEITERMMVLDTGKATLHLSLLRDAGVKVAIDDFGTGYCSLSLLQTLHIDYLKIDKCFTETIDSAGGDTLVLEAIISLSNRLNLLTIAEGISSVTQAIFMKEHKVTLLQGYLYSRPLKAVEFKGWYDMNGGKIDTVTE